MILTLQNLQITIYLIFSAKNVEDSLEQASVSLFRWSDNNLMKGNADKYHFLVKTSQEVSSNVEKFEIFLLELFGKTDH